MDYPLGPDNWLCRLINHWDKRYLDRNLIERKTCGLCGRTIPPFREVAQDPPYGFLPDDQQPPGAI